MCVLQTQTPDWPVPIMFLKLATLNDTKFWEVCSDEEETGWCAGNKGRCHAEEDAPLRIAQWLKLCTGFNFNKSMSREFLNLWTHSSLNVFLFIFSLYIPKYTFLHVSTHWSISLSLCVSMSFMVGLSRPKTKIISPCFSHLTGGERSQERTGNVTFF
jgi:hypothetical protein